MAKLNRVSAKAWFYGIVLSLISSTASLVNLRAQSRRFALNSDAARRQDSEKSDVAAEEAERRKQGRALLSYAQSLNVLTVTVNARQLSRSSLLMYLTSGSLPTTLATPISMMVLWVSAGGLKVWSACLWQCYHIVHGSAEELAEARSLHRSAQVCIDLRRSRQLGMCSSRQQMWFVEVVDLMHLCRAVTGHKNCKEYALCHLPAGLPGSMCGQNTPSLLGCFARDNPDWKTTQAFKGMTSAV